MERRAHVKCLDTFGICTLKKSWNGSHCSLQFSCTDTMIQDGVSAQQLLREKPWLPCWDGFQDYIHPHPTPNFRAEDFRLTPQTGGPGG